MSEENQVPQEEVQQETPAQEAPKAEETVQEEFSWADVEGTNDSVSAEHIALTELYEGTLGSSVEHQVVEGKVTSKTDREVIIDINSKSEGVVSLNEFRYNPELAVGDTVEV
jgi:small subunit ribosomal protein S1